MTYSLSLVHNLWWLVSLVAAPQGANAFGGVSPRLSIFFGTSNENHIKSFPSLHSSLFAESSFGESDDGGYQLSIEYCTGCRWNLKAYWLAQEVLSTFSKEPKLSAVTLVPSRPSINPPAVFRAEIAKTGGADTPTLLWDRKEEGGFPQPKDLKQMVRDLLSPDMFLGHSDTADKQAQKAEAGDKEEIVDLSVEAPEPVDVTLEASDIDNAKTPNVAITYCCGCKWLLRAAYYAQELTTTFGEEVNSLTLIPSRPPAKGGAFVVSVTATEGAPVVVWDRIEQGRFPEPKELKQKIRDLLNPEKDLGHSDASKAQDEEMSDEEAEEARKFYGVA